MFTIYLINILPNCLAVVNLHFHQQLHPPIQSSQNTFHLLEAPFQTTHSRCFHDLAPNLG